LIVFDDQNLFHTTQSQSHFVLLEIQLITDKIGSQRRVHNSVTKTAGRIPANQNVNKF
jgi:hypothetical protein